MISSPHDLCPNLDEKIMEHPEHLIMVFQRAGLYLCTSNCSCTKARVRLHGKGYLLMKLLGASGRKRQELQPRFSLVTKQDACKIDKHFVYNRHPSTREISTAAAIAVT